MWKNLLPTSFRLRTDYLEVILISRKLSSVAATLTSSVCLPTSLGSSWIMGNLWVRLPAKQGLQYLAMQPRKWFCATVALILESDRNINAATLQEWHYFCGSIPLWNPWILFLIESFRGNYMILCSIKSRCQDENDSGG